MNKKNKNSGIIFIASFIAIIIISVCAFQKENIIHKYYELTIEKKYSQANVNEYYVEDNFEYVNNYDNLGINSKKNLTDFIYYALNSGTNYTKRYIDKDYTDYNRDVKLLTQNEENGFKETISILNNFIHPYNSSDNIKLTYNGDYTIEITINRAYSEEEINEINIVVDTILKEKITNSMPAREKIKVIHDYIIDHTEYDKLKYDNKNDSTYKSNTAYGVLMQGYGTCNGYADAMAIFLNKMNIINYKISNDEHIWNLVYLDGKWYHLDLTWDDPISDVNVNRTTYFLISTEVLEKLNDETHDFDKTIYTEAA